MTSASAIWVESGHSVRFDRMGYSQHAGIAILADGTERADEIIARTLWNDPASGVIRHADAGYKSALDCAVKFGLDLPMSSTEPSQ